LTSIENIDLITGQKEECSPADANFFIFTVLLFDSLCSRSYVEINWRRDTGFSDEQQLSFCNAAALKLPPIHDSRY